jgi:hypothetical protein
MGNHEYIGIAELEEEFPVQSAGMID